MEQIAAGATSTMQPFKKHAVRPVVWSDGEMAGLAG
jgi:hypothetical protein